MEILVTVGVSILTTCVILKIYHSLKKAKEDKAKFERFCILLDKITPSAGGLNPEECSEFFHLSWWVRDYGRNQRNE